MKTYIDPQAIAKNKILTQQKKSYLTGNSDLSNPYTLGYILARTWERDFRARVSVLVNEILDTEVGLHTTLGISQESLLRQLDILAKYEIIEQRSAKPYLSGIKPPRKDEGEHNYQIFRCWQDPLELLEKAYDNDLVTPNRPLIQSLSNILDEDGDDVPDFSDFLGWASGLVALDGGSCPIFRLVS